MLPVPSIGMYKLAGRLSREKLTEDEEREGEREGPFELSVPAWGLSRGAKRSNRRIGEALRAMGGVEASPIPSPTVAPSCGFILSRVGEGRGAGESRLGAW